MRMPDETSEAGRVGSNVGLAIIFLRAPFSLLTRGLGDLSVIRKNSGEFHLFQDL